MSKHATAFESLDNQLVFARAEASMCLWEAVLELPDFPYRLEHGSPQTRFACWMLAPSVCALYNFMTELEEDRFGSAGLSFDWDFVPAFVEATYDDWIDYDFLGSCEDSVMSRETLKDLAPKVWSIVTENHEVKVQLQLQHIRKKMTQAIDFIL